MTSKVDSNKLRFNAKNEMTDFCKFGADLINISKVTSRKTTWPHFFWPTLQRDLRKQQKT